MTVTRSLSVCAALSVLAAAAPAAAEEFRTGDVLVRVQGTVVNSDTSADVSVGGVLNPAFDASLDTEVIPTLTLSYFFNKNLSVELFCCFAKLQAEGEGGISGLDLGDFWVFPPALTLQYHFDTGTNVKPYIGAGAQYIHFFGEGNSGLGGAEIQLDDALGFVLQAGVDVSVGGSWYLNADVKHTWISTDASWTGTTVTADVDIDPWIFSLGVGYRFNVEDVFAR